MNRMTPAEFEGMVTRATEAATTAATKNVAEMLMTSVPRRILILAVTVAFIIGAGLALPTTIILNHENARTALANSEANCESQAEARPQSNARAFVQQITLELAEDAFHTFPARFREAEIAKINGELAKARQTAPGELPPAIHDLSDLSAVIRPLPLIDCNARIGA